MTVIFDTNVLVSAILKSGSQARRSLTDAISSERIAISEELFREYEDVITRPKIARVTSKVDRDLLLAALGRSATWIDVRTEVHLCRDPKDNFILALAIDAKADYLVTGDFDLLELDHPHRFRIISIREFSELSS